MILLGQSVALISLNPLHRAGLPATFSPLMKEPSMFTQQRLQELLHYDPTTGVFTRLVQTSGNAKIGDVAGSRHVAGYRQCHTDGKVYLSHRLAWLYMTGSWPIDQIDHRNGVRNDNRWSNLREATQAENQQNHKMRRDNTSGFIGVARFRNKWRAQIQINGRLKHIGCFTTPDDAHAAYLAAKAELHTFQPALREQVA